METLNLQRTRTFVQFCMQNNVQVTVNRRAAYGLLVEAIEDEGSVQFPFEKFEKLQSFLLLNDQQVHYADASNAVSIYAFVRLLGDLRRVLKTVERRTTDTGSVSSQEEREQA